MCANGELKKPETRYGVNGNDHGVATSAFNVLTVTLAAFLGSARRAALKGSRRDGSAG